MNDENIKEEETKVEEEVGSSEDTNKEEEELLEDSEVASDGFEDDKKLSKKEKKQLLKEKKSKEQEQIAKLEDKIKKLEDDVAKYKNEYLKALADSQNFQKRINEQAIKDRKYASQKVVGELIGPISMLQQVISIPQSSPEVQNYVYGFQMISNQLVEILKNEGLGPIDTKVGDEFDANFMQVVDTVSEDDMEDNKVTKIMQPGYMYKDRVLKPTMVVVNKKVKKEEVKEENENNDLNNEEGKKEE